MINVLQVGIYAQEVDEVMYTKERRPAGSIEEIKHRFIHFHSPHGSSRWCQVET